MEKETGKHLAGGSRKAQPRAKKPKAKKPKKPSRFTRQQKILIAIAAVLAVLVVIVAACQSLFVRPDVSSKPSTGDTETEEIDWGDGIRPRSDGERKSEDYYTVLILGRDTGGGGNTDTILLASYDVTNQKATVMSIPRDTMVNVSWDVKKINSVYNWYGGGDKGIQYLYKEISQLVGFEPDYQVVIEWEAVGQIVDAMGGVWFDVPRDMNYDDPYQDLSIHISAGYQLLDGEQAMGVLRYRHDNTVNGVTLGYADGDLGRIKTQQAFLEAMLEQLLQIKNVTKINDFIKVFQENVETDLSFQNILWFAQQAIFGGLSTENVNFVTMPNKTVSCWSRTYQNYQSYVVPIADELLELVNSELSPYVEEFTLSDLDIMSVNADGSISSSTGHVEDTQAASPPVTSSGSSSTTTDDEEETTEPVVDENGNILDPETGEIVGGSTDTGGTTGGSTDTGGTTGGGTDTGGTTGGDTGTGGTTGGGTDTGGTTGGSTDTGGTAGGGTDTGGTTGGDTDTGGTTGSDTGTTTDSGTGGDFSIIDPAPAA